VSDDEIFVSDGAKCDTGNIQEIFATDIRVAIPDPVYPVYLDTNVMAGRTGAYDGGRYHGITYLECNRENDYVPQLPPKPVDLIYLCFPNNPTGATISHAQLKLWVDYARSNKALILFDAAYEAFMRDEDLPRSIYEVEGAREVAIEFRSFSKTAGFTGTRCAYTVVPKSCIAYTASGEPVRVYDLWNRRHTTKFNSVSYPVQRAAEAIYSPEGQAQVKELTDYYLTNADYIRKAIQKLGFDCVGGENSPYIWVDGRSDSWDFFDLLLNKAGVVCTPGAGFGQCGRGYIRISAFNSFENVQKAMNRIQTVLG
jgi:LL-diaminopimelate aminotransferase